MEYIMPLFTWKDKYSVGNEEIDLQHKELFDIFNRLYDNSCEVDNTIDVYATLDELITYADHHFSTELKYMLDIGYKDIDEQINEHLYFTKKVLSLTQNRDMNTSELTKETIVFLGKWLLNHVTEEDKKITT
jgi:hemerythrin